MILKPPKIYLDTNHLIYIAKVRKGKKLPNGLKKGAYQYIDDSIKSYCGVIFNKFAPIEWVEGKATQKSANEIAAVIDSAKLRYQLEADCFIYTHEVLEACKQKNPNIKTPNLKILQVISDGGFFESAMGILAEKVPDFIEEHKLPHYIQNASQIPKKVPVTSARQFVEQSFRFKEQYPDRYKKRVNDFKESLSEDIDGKNEYLKSKKKYQVEWMKRFLKADKILEAFNPNVDIDNILNQIDTKSCQAVNLYWKVREKRMMSGNPPEDNDVDDYMFIPVVPYADIILTEKNLRTFILQTDQNLSSKVFCKATGAAEALRNIGSSSQNTEPRKQNRRNLN